LTDTIAPPAGSKDAHIYGPEGKNEMVVGFDKDGGLKEVKKWSATDTYASGDVVHHMGSIWWASAPAVGEQPGVSTEWTLYIGGSGNLGNPTKDDQLLSSKTDGTRLWVDPAPASEAPLGNPTKDGDILASTTAGVRSWVDPPTGLEKITEGGKTGWRLVGANPADYGDIGDNAVDLSVNQSASTTRGATGDRAFASGAGNTSSGRASFATGLNTQSLNETTFAAGRIAEATGYGSVAISTSQNVNRHIKTSGGYAGSYNVNPLAASVENAAVSAVMAGGEDNNITAAAKRSVVLGGTGQTATQPDTLYYPKGKMQGQAADPTGLTAADEGMMWWNTTSHQLKVWDGTAIKTVQVV
jgi:hypothetical protein